MSTLVLLIVACSTQETLDEGVQKVREIYKNFGNVGIKDRSMIWNSLVYTELRMDFTLTHFRWQ